MKTLYPFQLDAVNFMKTHTRCILALEQGLGKSVTLIETVKQLRASRILCVVPNSLKLNWKNEIESHYPNAPILVLDHPTTKERMAALLYYKKGFVIVNYEGIRGENRKNFKTNKTGIEGFLLRALMTIDWQVIGFDEGHRLKNRKAKQTFGALHLAKKTKALYILTGTPVLNRGQELFPYLQMIDDKKYSSYWKFIGNHFAEGTYPHMVVQDHPKNSEALKTELTPYLIRKTKAEVLPDLPEKVYQKIWLNMEGEQKRIYDEMESKMIAELKVGSFLEYLERAAKEKDNKLNAPDDFSIEHVISPIILTKMLRLKQICFCPYLISKDVRQSFHSVKIDALMDIVNGTQEKIAVFSQFKQGINILAKEMEEDRIGHVVYTGDVSLEDRDIALKRFNTDSNCRVFLGTSQLGLGFNLQENCSTLVFMDKLWNPASQEQVQDRIHRIGQTKKCQIIELLANASIEWDIETMLERKSSIISSILGG